MTMVVWLRSARLARAGEASGAGSASVRLRDMPRAVRGGGGAPIRVRPPSRSVLSRRRRAGPPNGAVSGERAATTARTVRRARVHDDEIRAPGRPGPGSVRAQGLLGQLEVLAQDEKVLVREVPDRPVGALRHFGLVLVDVLLVVLHL